MEHTNYYDTFKSIRHHIIDEIKTAVKAHGGKYEWEDDGASPLVSANPDIFYPQPLDIYINAISLDDNGSLVLEVTNKETGCEIDDIKVDDIFVEHLGYIIDDMEETPEVSDVSIPLE